MQFSEQWLRKWLLTQSSSDQLINALTTLGLEVDSVTPAAPDFSGVVVAKVLTRERHPDADRLSVCTVDTGDQQYNVVCGAPNVRADLKVAFVKVGGVLPDNFKIKKAKLRGVESQGMICSSRELGLGQEHDGIIELPDDAPVGKDFREYYELNDTMIDVDLTPNRGDCASILGIARDLSAKFNEPVMPFQPPSIPASLSETRKITVALPQACPRYVGRIVRDINPSAKTPVWMQERLRRSGLRSVHPVVDIGNYVMLEVGQPLHAFDLEKLSGDITVRFAHPNEKITLLDGKSINLCADNLVIADESQPQAIAGVMGAKASAVDENTQHLFLESACFSTETIVRSAQKLNLSTDASYRFERGVDYTLQVAAMEYFTQLILEICGGKPAEVIEVLDDAQLPKATGVTLREAQIQRMLGIAIQYDEVTDILTRLNCSPVVLDGKWSVLPPSYRYDLRIEADFIEEIIRIYGYEHLPSTLGNVQFNPQATQSNLPYLWLPRLLADLGYFEAINYSFVSPKIQSHFAALEDCLTLANPLTQEMSVMRTSLWPGLLQSLQYNLNHQVQRVRLFETGMCFIPKSGELQQVEKVAGVLAGRRHDLQWSLDDTPVDFFDAKGDVEQVFKALGYVCEWRKADSKVLHPGQCAEIVVAGQVVGLLGALHPDVVNALDLNTMPYLFELDLSNLGEKGAIKFKNIVKFPAVWRDIAIVMDEAISAQAVEDCILQAAGHLLREVKIFDIYQGEGIELGKKSLAISLLFQDSDATLVDEQVNELIERIVAALQQSYQAVMR